MTGPRTLALALALTLALALALALRESSSTVPPVAEIRPYSVTLHGDTRVDDYHWLRDKGAPEVTAYLEAENAYADAVMDPTAELQAQLYDEIVARIQETDQSAPYRKGAFEYYHRTEEGKQYKTYCRRQPGEPATEQLLLDMNALAEGKPFLGLGAYEVSPDGRYLAYSLDETGFRDYTLRIKDLESDRVFPERIEKVKSVAWASDSETFFYTVDDETKRPNRVLRHRLGADADDPVLYQEDDERFRVAVWRSRSGELVFRGAFSHTTSEVAFVPANEPHGAWRLVAEREQDHEYDVAHRGEELWIRTNDAGRNFRIVRAPLSDPGREAWAEVVAHRSDVMVEGLDVFEGFYALRERERGLPYIRLSRFSGGDPERIEIDEPVYALHPGANEEFGASAYRFRYESLTAPDSVFDYEVATKQRSLVKQLEVLGGYDPDGYESERL